jgi:Barrel-sandwich domain of CusB or HlyD membrane-fusion
VRRGALLVVLALVAAACGGAHEPAAEHREGGPAAAVPGVETAPATTAMVRDEVTAFGVVTAEAEPPAARDARAALAQAETRLTLARQQVRRLEALVGVAPRKELEAARAEEAAAAMEVARLRQAVAAFGGADPKETLAHDDAWVIAQVLQRDVLQLETGGRATFVPDAFVEVRFEGRIDAPPAYVDPASGTAPARLRVRDPAARLRPGMTGRATLEVGAPREAIVVPAAAVVYDDAQPFVFVAQDGRYERHPVELRALHDGRYEVRSGLSAGTPVVVTGAASLLSAVRLRAGEGH